MATLEEPATRLEDTVEIVAVPPRERMDVVAPNRPGEEKRHDELIPAARLRRPFWLRPRGRATVVVAVLGGPLVVLYAVARVRADALWFEEVGQLDVLRQVMLLRAELYVVVALAVAAVVGVNLLIAVRRTGIARSLPETLGLVGASLATGTLFAAYADGRWQTVALWRHRQSFGVIDPVFGKDIGFFVFTLPFEVLLSWLLIWTVVVVAGYVAVVYWIRGWLGLRPLRAAFEAQVHLAALAAVLLLVVAWRIHLEQYMVELGQPASGESQSFAGAGFIDVHVRIPGLAAIMVLVVALALGCLAAPFVARAGRGRPAATLVVVPAAMLVLAVVTVGALLPALVQRYAVDPNPLPSERPYLERSISATRRALDLDSVDVQPYAPTGNFSVADFSPATSPFGNVLIWDPWLLEARMQELVTDTPYYHPLSPTLDVVRVGHRRRPTIVGARELDLGVIGDKAHGWINSRLSYTHGLGLVRYSGTAVGADRQPRLLDSGLDVAQPRIYFGDLPTLATAEDEEGDGTTVANAANRPPAESPWVLADTARPEVDVPASKGLDGTAYHYGGAGGIPLSSWIDRAVFALDLGSIELLRSDDVTPSSRLLLHRDVMDRLRTLAPFIQWDSDAVPLTANGRIVFVVDGYTTSANYPYAERVAIGRSSVSYARASVRATVDAYSGSVAMYRTDPADPIARAWAEMLPTLFRPADEMPVVLRSRLRYPQDLFNAQATAYETFHATRADVFANNSDAWSRPIALSGPIEVAGDVTFDEDDEDDLRLIMRPSYTYSTPPGLARPRLVLGTYYSPLRGQNLVATLSGWIDASGRLQLTARSFPRNPVVLGPAQMSRMVFATPRVSNLLGLRNLEIRDLDKSSLDTVLLGTPHLLFLDGGVVQIQSLYEGSRGPGAARLIGVTAFMNGRGGLGPDIQSAVRQALNMPPRIAVLRPPDSVVVGRPLDLAFRVKNADRERVTITTRAGTEVHNLTVGTGIGHVAWVPTLAGPVEVRIEVAGLDGTRATGTLAFRVMARAPVIRLIGPPSRAVVGQHVRVPFEVERGLREVAEVSTREGIVFSRRFLIRDGIGIVGWTPKSAGLAVLRIKVLGHQGQRVSTTLRIPVSPGRNGVPPPTLALLEVPDSGAIGEESSFAFRAEHCSEAVAQIEGPGDAVQVWRFACPARPAAFTWTPAEPGAYRFTASAVGRDTTVQTSTGLTVEPAP